MKRFVSLYSGAGGLDLGFIAAGFVPVFANDISADAMKTYSAAMDTISKKTGKTLNHKIVTGDIREVEELPSEARRSWSLAGHPASFSVAGKMDPNDPRSAASCLRLSWHGREGSASGVCDGERQSAR